MKTLLPGPFDGNEWPQELNAHVVTPGENPAIHGYRVEDDLAKHYSFSDFIFLSLTGELPEQKVGKVFEKTLFFLAPTSVAEAPAHAGGLARLCGGSTSSVLGTAIVALAEQARYTMNEHADFLQWLNGEKTEFPECFLIGDEGDHASVKRLKYFTENLDFIVPALQQDLTRMAAVLAVLHACGLKTQDQLETLFVITRSPCVAAESLAVTPGNLRSYPLNLPNYVYEEKR